MVMVEKLSYIKAQVYLHVGRLLLGEKFAEAGDCMGVASKNCWSLRNKDLRLSVSVI